MNGDDRLRVLFADVDARARDIAAGRDWPCRKGCDHCCRNLANAPRLTASEWELLRTGLLALDPAARQEIAAAVRALPDSGKVVCPLLGGAGECRVYEFRPLACRTYGFYRERDRGLYCEAISTRVELGEFEDVTWGNAEAIEERLSHAGDVKSLRAWWEADSCTVA